MAPGFIKPKVKPARSLTNCDRRLDVFWPKRMLPVPLFRSRCSRLFLKRFDSSKAIRSAFRHASARLLFLESNTRHSFGAAGEACDHSDASGPCLGGPHHRQSEDERIREPLPVERRRNVEFPGGHTLEFEPDPKPFFDAWSIGSTSGFQANAAEPFRRLMWTTTPMKAATKPRWRRVRGRDRRRRDRGLDRRRRRTRCRRRKQKTSVRSAADCRRRRCAAAGLPDIPRTAEQGRPADRGETPISGTGRTIVQSCHKPTRRRRPRGSSSIGIISSGRSSFGVFVGSSIGAGAAIRGGWL